MHKQLLAAFNESIERGKSEEIGSIDSFEVAGQTYFVNKTGRASYALFEENNIVPIAERPRFAPRKRTALDGRVWWAPFDALTGRFSTLTIHGKYKTRRDCLAACVRSID